MGLFDIFKSKSQRDTEEMLGRVMGQIFPNGDADVIRDSERVRKLTGDKIPEDKLRGFVQGCKVLLAISQNHTEASFIQSFKVRSENKITDAQAKEVYAYLAGEATYIDNMARVMPGAGNTAQIKSMFASGTYADSIEGAQGEFGTSVNNPIPTICVRSSMDYLARLRYRGEPVENKRTGSTSSPVTSGSIDIYQLMSGGRPVGTVYLCPYHKNTSKLAPRGFTLS